MQQRSGKIYLQAKQEDFDTGKLGEITMAHIRGKRRSVCSRCLRVWIRLGFRVR